MKDTELNIAYEIEGEGQPLLFLHGFLENKEIWKDIIPNFLVDGFRCITIDLPCHGMSRFHNDKCSMKFMATQVHELLNKLNIKEKITVIGHSMGGYVGLELNLLRSAKIVLLHSNFWADSASKREDRDRVIEIVKHGKTKFIQEAIPNLFSQSNKTKCDEIIKAIISSSCQIPTNEIQAATAGMRDRRGFYDLSRHELCMIHGSEDPIISTKILHAELKKLKYKIELVTLPEVGHMSIWEDEAALIKAIKSLIIQ